MKRFFSIKYSDNAHSFAMLLLRVVFGLSMLISHGYGKLTSFQSKSSSFPDFFHIGHSTSMALVIFAEFFCAVLIVLGLLTRFAAIPLIITMAVALFLANHGQVFGQGSDAAFFLTAFIAILFGGPGKVSFDRLFGK